MELTGSMLVKQNYGTNKPEGNILFLRRVKKVKKLVTKARKNSWNEFGKRMERSNTENQQLFYGTFKTCKKRKKK